MDKLNGTKEAELDALRGPHKSIYVLTREEAKCEDCPWRHPDTCRECKGGKK